MAFPVSPTNGQTAIVNGISYTYSSATRSWARSSGILSSNLLIVGTLGVSSNATVNGLTVNTTATIAGGIQNTPIGNATANTGTFTTVTAQTVNAAAIGNAGAAFTGASISAATIGNTGATHTGGTYTGTDATFTTKVTTSNLATGAINANGAVTVSSLTANGAISGTTGTFGSGVVTTTLNANANITVVNLTVNTNATISSNVVASNYIISGSGIYYSNGSAFGGAVSSVTGTANQITVSPTTGAVVVSLPASGIQNIPIGNATANTGNFTTVNAATVNAASIGNAGTAFTGASISAATIGNTGAAISGTTATLTGNLSANNSIITTTGSVGSAQNGAIYISNDTSYYAFPVGADATSSWTLSMWIYLPTQTINYTRGLWTSSGNQMAGYLGWNGLSTYSLNFFKSGVGYVTLNLAGAPSQNAWHFCTWSYNSSTGTMYVGFDGTVASGSTTPANDGDWFIGAKAGPVINSASPTYHTDVGFQTTAQYTSNFSVPTTHPAGSGYKYLALATSSGTYLTNSGNTSPTTFSTSGSGISYVAANPIAASGNLTVYGTTYSSDIVPLTNITSNIGSTTAYYNNLFGSTYNSGSGGIIPTANLTGNIGSTTAYYKNVFANAYTSGPGGVLPSANLTGNIGSTTAYYNNIFGGTVTGTDATFTTKVTTSNLATGAINANGAVTVSSLASNGAVSGTTGTFGSGVVTTTLNANSTATVNALTSNGAITGTTGTFGSGVVTTTLNANANITVVNLTVNTNATISSNIVASNYIISGTGIFYSNGTAYSSGGGGVAGNITATDNTTATTLYPVMVGAAGTSQVANVTTTKLTYNASSGNLSTSNLSITGTAIFWANGSPAVYNSSFWVQNQDFGLTANTADYANTLGLVSDTVDTSYDNGSVLGNAAVDGGQNIVDYTITGTKFSNSIVISTSGNITTTANISAGNISTTANISAGNITTTANISAGNLTVTSNISTGNISTTGSAGIGTTSPAASLAITKQTTALSGSSNSYGLYLYPTSSGLAYIDAVTSSTGTASLGLRTYNNNTYNEVRMDSSGNLGINTTSPTAKLDVVGPASVTSFTGSTRLGATVRGSTAATDYSGIDLIGYNQTNPVARIAVLTTGSGSNLSIGTSNSYATGITNTALTIDYNGHTLPGANATYNLGSTTSRWLNVYTSDLDLSNQFGSWTIVEGEDDLFLYNNKKGKVYKFMLQEVDPSTAPPKARND